jgi:hypothetical protein
VQLWYAAFCTTERRWPKVFAYNEFDFADPNAIGDRYESELIIAARFDAACLPAKSFFLVRSAIQKFLIENNSTHEVSLIISREM